MKKITFLVIFLVGIMLLCQAQKPYSFENLEKLPQSELDVYLNKAIKLQKSGRTMNIVGGSILGGTAATILGMAVIDDGDWALGAAVVAFFGGIAGLGTMAVGIPMNIKGKKRVERINAIKNTAFNDFNVTLNPCAQYNLTSKNYQPAISVRIRF